MQSIQPQVIKRLFALFVVTFSSLSMAQTVQIIPTAPRYLEPVYARIPGGGSIRAFMRLRLRWKAQYLPYGISG